MIAFFYSLIIKELLPEGKMKRPSRQAKNNKLTILALSIVEFRGDIECIVNTNEFRVLVIPDQWQRRLAHQFYPVIRQKYLLRNNPSLNDYKYKKAANRIQILINNPPDPVQAPRETTNKTVATTTKWHADFEYSHPHKAHPHWR